MPPRRQARSEPASPIATCASVAKAAVLPGVPSHSLQMCPCIGTVGLAPAVGGAHPASSEPLVEVGDGSIRGLGAGALAICDVVEKRCRCGEFASQIG